MKLIIGIIVTLVFVWSSGCSKEDKSKENFIETYKEILVIREMYQDSTKANESVKLIFKKNGYTEKSFFDEWKKYTSNPQNFNQMMDTIRQRAQMELIKLNKRPNHE